ncbi:eCIS core domain-containing protein [Paenibacillus aestuarii]|uniref:DUF4157 domain-containing protein n=1 Tax=Paenibacillus aestuarii TaxID=516965 RepID=A0ABW0KA82_9BACL|nr:DUF4157 domain-containing protein [Paenibacillus aestuarii]
MHQPRINRQPDTSLHTSKKNKPAQASAADPLSIQRMIGNRAVGSMLNVQTKLTVGAAGDAYEQEADQMGKSVADHIAANDSIQRSEGEETEEEELQMKPSSESIQRSEGEETEEEALQMKPSSESIQRSEGEETEEEALQMKPSSESIQRSEGEETEEEALQMKPLSESIQRSEGEETEEEALQMKPSSESIQRSEGEETEEEALQMKPSSESIQRSEGEETEEEALQMKSSDGGSFEASSSVESRIQAQQGGGSKMDERIQAKMESAFNADFDDVRIHSNSESSALNRSLGAEAFATGNDIFFREGRYNPDSRDGQELLGHELTHVIQQRGGK